MTTDAVYKKWTSSVITLCMIFVFIIFSGEVLSYFYTYNENLTSFLALEYLKTRVLLPTGINITLITISYVLFEIKKISKNVKSVIPLCLFLCLSCSFVYFHHKSPISLISFAIPIILSIQYSDKKLTKIISYICVLVSILITSLILYNSKTFDFYYLVGILLGLVFLLGLTYCSYLMVKLEEMKQNILLDSINETNIYKERALIDELTGLYNHAAYSEKIDKLLQSDKLVLSIIDIDHFKKVNDKFGHDFGNIVLKYLGNVLNSASDIDTFVSRYGGEEFVIIFKSKTPKQALKIIERLKIEFNYVVKEETGKKISFSGGIANKKKYDDATSLFNKADKALYVAKESGRDKIMIYEEK